MATNKPSGKKAPPKNNFQHDLKTWVNTTVRQVWHWIAELERCKEIESNNYQLGHHHLALGHVSDAILRFKFVTWLNPKRADAFYYLGCSYLTNKNKKAARDALVSAVKLNSDYEEAAYMLALVAGKALPASRIPKKMPLILAREYFDSQAASYNKEQIDIQGYQGHTVLCNALRSQLVPGQIDHVILELGVGTGLCGLLIHDVATHVTGVDISEKMLAEAAKLQDAQGKKLYDALVCRDLQSFLNDAPDAGYDIVMAASLLSYMGDVKDVFAQTARVLKPGGLFAFTADKMNGEGYEFNAPTARFRFSKSHLEGLATAAGLAEVKFVEADSYPDAPAWLCIFKK